MKRPILSAGFVLLALLSACSYRLVRDGARLPAAGIESVAVPLSRNQTTEAGLEDAFTQALLERLRADGRVRVAPAGQAQAELRCTLKALEVGNSSYDRNGRETASQATLRAECRLVATDGGANIWSTGEVSASEQYPVGNDPLANESARAAALAEICRDLAETVRALLLDSF
jgi:outer membrane lipopolysaccharide assembly protein LptE/RlpB